MTTFYPSSDIELYGDDSLLDPYANYRTLRDAGPAVWLDRYDMFFIGRFGDVRDAQDNWRVFSSAHGVTLNDKMNETLAGGLLCSDDPHHQVLRNVIGKPLAPQEVAALKDRVAKEAEFIVDKLVSRGSFDAATELAQYLPVTIVSELVGLPEDGRERMLDWAEANFNCIGPMNDRTRDAFEIVGEMVEYAFTQCVRGKLKPGGWADMIWDAADRGEIDRALCPFLMNDYMGPSLDTTIFATSSAVWLFARNPDQWARVRENPKLIPNAINEALRMETPIQGFSRYLTRDHDLDGVTLPEGSRAIVMYASGNRDERRWDEPERFDVSRRQTGDHLAFGRGAHVCLGAHLARLEMRCLFEALTRRVERFELGATERCINNILRGLAKCEVTVH